MALVTYPSKRKIGRFAGSRLPHHMNADGAVIAGSRFAAFQRQGERDVAPIPGSRWAGWLRQRGVSS